jgi:hypothetical protein
MFSALTALRAVLHQFEQVGKPHTPARSAAARPACAPARRPHCRSGALRTARCTAFRLFERGGLVLPPRLMRRLGRRRASCHLRVAQSGVHRQFVVPRTGIVCCRTCAGTSRLQGHAQTSLPLRRRLDSEVAATVYSQAGNKSDVKESARGGQRPCWGVRWSRRRIEAPSSESSWRLGSQPVG